MIVLVKSHFIAWRKSSNSLSILSRKLRVTLLYRAFILLSNIILAFPDCANLCSLLYCLKSVVVGLFWTLNSFVDLITAVSCRFKLTLEVQKEISFFGHLHQELDSWDSKQSIRFFWSKLDDNYALMGKKNVVFLINYRLLISPHEVFLWLL